MKITKDSWKRLSFPDKRENLDFSAFYSDARGEAILAGHKPTDMDDRWFIYSEDGWIYFHRSWTGACIFALKLDGSPIGIRTTDSWVTRDHSQYNWIDIKDARGRLSKLIDSYFPEPSNA